MEEKEVSTRSIMLPNSCGTVHDEGPVFSFLGHRASYWREGWGRRALESLRLLKNSFGNQKNSLRSERISLRNQRISLRNPMISLLNQRTSFKNKRMSLLSPTISLRNCIRWCSGEVRESKYFSHDVVLLRMCYCLFCACNSLLLSGWFALQQNEI